MGAFHSNISMFPATPFAGLEPLSNLVPAAFLKKRMNPLQRLSGKPKLLNDQYFVDDKQLIVDQRLSTNSYYLFLGEIDQGSEKFQVKYHKVIQDYHIFRRMNEYLKPLLN